jgi:GntR family transcriptional regulator
MSPLPDGLRARVDRGSDLPLGAQLARSLRDWIGRAAPGTRLPSVRELAAEAGVNVNTARAVYQRLENEGLVRSEQGRGTFVSGGKSEAAQRAELRRQIALLEGELARRPLAGSDPFAAAPRQSAKLMSAEALREVRDDLLARLESLDQARSEVLERLAELEAEDRIAELELEAAEHATADPGEARRSSLSVPGARVRWVGA